MKTVLFLMLFFIGQAHAGSVDELLFRMQQIQDDPEVYQLAIELGAERAVLCGYCHGKDGNSAKKDVPNLAGQNPKYLLVQWQAFANKERRNYVMERLAPGMSDEDRINLALYYAQKKVKAPRSDIKPSRQGADLYHSFCFACHGDEGYGGDDLPRLAGQSETYLRNTLMKFYREDDSRKNSPMIGVVKNLTEADIKAVATYISLMP